MAEAECALFVEGLPSDVTKEELQDVFSTYGDVKGVRILSRGQDGGRRKRAVVSYAEAEDAEDAMEALNGVYKIREEEEAPIKVKWAASKEAAAAPVAPQEPEEGADAGEAVAPACEDGAVEPEADSQDEAHARPSGGEGHKVFVGNLPGDCGEQELRAVFATYGEVGHVYILKPQAKSAMRCAFVFYKTQDAGAAAISVLNGQYKIREDAREPILVSWPKRGGKGWKGGAWDKEPGCSPSKGSGPSRRSGHGRQDGLAWEEGGSASSGDRRRAEERGEPCVNPVCAYLAHSSGEGEGYCCGMCWSVHQTGQGWRQHGPWCEHRSARCGDEDGRGGWSSSSRRGGEAQRGQKRGRPPVCGEDAGERRLHVANIPEDIKPDALEYLFNHYGRVVNVHIVAGPVGGVVSALVEYERAEEAEVAVASLDERYEIRDGVGRLSVRPAREWAKRARTAQSDRSAG